MTKDKPQIYTTTQSKNKTESSSTNQNLSVTNEQIPAPLEEYIVQVNNPYPDDLKDWKYPNNRIKTSKYTWWNFLPKNLYLQFSKVNNAYFLIILVLQVIKAVSITQGKPSVLLPLVMVIMICVIKDIIEDIKRQSADKQENIQLVDVIQKDRMEFLKIKCEDLLVGNIVKLHKNEQIPADILLIGTSSQNSSCQVETKNLDGETNFKTKSLPKDSENYSDINKLHLLQQNIQCEIPSENIYRFNGVLVNDSVTPDGTQNQPLDINNLLLRGTILRSTDYVYGVVVYTGHNTKIMKNQNKLKTKISKTDRFTYRQTMYMFLVQLAICLFSAAYGTSYEQKNHDNQVSYLNVQYQHQSKELSLMSHFFQKFSIWFQVFQHMVPISLIITLESVRFSYALFMSWDAEMYDQEKDMPAKIQSSNLNEELGQVTHIFTDKTGTITNNIMKFNSFQVGENIFGLNQQESNQSSYGPKDLQVGFYDSDFEDLFLRQNVDSLLHQMIQAMAICHTVQIDEMTSSESISYQASSPDELALVKGAKALGYMFQHFDQNSNIISILSNAGAHLKYQLLNVIEFDSFRQRMSIIVKDDQQNIKLICKGSDSMIFSLLRENEKASSEFETCLQFINLASQKGLRTLVYGIKDISEDDILTAMQQIKVANHIKNEELKNLRLKEIYSLLEKDLSLLGSTAVEDSLQDQVVETIKQIQEVGIKLWLLTGDKIETAICIGYNSGLLNSDQQLLQLKSKDALNLLIELNSIQANMVIQNKKQAYSLVIDGQTLSLIQENIKLQEVFLKICSQIKVLLACRVSPKQKAELVAFVRKDFPSEITLAIGDGANDVSMINEAHIGIGILGKEGSQASRASDYAIGQFKYLRNLLFVHGRESYRKNTYLICYMYYKNIVFVATQFWFGFLNQFSGQGLYEQWIQQVYNIIFTSLPIMWFAIFDQENDRETLLKTSDKYKLGMKGKLFGSVHFWRFVVFAFLQSLFILFVVCYTLEEESVNPNGHPASLWMIGMIIYCCIIFAVNFEIIYNTYSHTLISIGCIILSIGSYFAFYKVQDTIKLMPELNGTFFFLWKTPTFTFIIIFIMFFQLIIQTIITWLSKLQKIDFYMDFNQKIHIDNELQIFNGTPSLEGSPTKRVYLMNDQKSLYSQQKLNDQEIDFEKDFNQHQTNQLNYTLTHNNNISKDQIIYDDFSTMRNRQRSAGFLVGKLNIKKRNNPYLYDAIHKNIDHREQIDVLELTDQV
eukprot:403355333